MRLSRFAPFLLAVVSCLAAAKEAQARYEGNFNLFVGQKWLNQGDWAPVDEQPQVGLMLAFGEERAPVHFSIEAFVTEDDAQGADPTVDRPVKTSSAEFAIGVRKIWKSGATRPHLGAGASVIRVREDDDGPSGPEKHEARGYGVWIDGGVSWRLAGHLNLGVEARYSSSNVDLGSGFVVRDVAAGGFQAGLLLGYGW